MLKSVFLLFASTVLVGCTGSAPFLGTSKTEYCEGFNCKPDSSYPEPISLETKRSKTTVPVNWNREEKLDLPKNWLSDRTKKKGSDNTEINK